MAHHSEVSIMTIDAFEASLSLPNPPQEWDAALQALWWDARGDWNQAHALAQLDAADTRCAWVHAYLHRKEGDPSNAAYWYRRAHRSPASDSLAAEWRAIATTLLTQSAGQPRDGTVVNRS